MAGEPKGASNIASAAWAALKRVRGPAALVWVVSAAAMTLAIGVARAAGLAASDSSSWVKVLISVVVGGFGSAALLNLLIVGDLKLQRRWAPVAKGAALFALGELVAFLPSGVALSGSSDLYPLDPGRILAALLLGAVLVFAELRLALWPVAQIAGQRGLGPRASWAAMKGSVGALVGVYLIFSLLPFMGYAVLVLPFVRGLDPLPLWAGAVNNLVGMASRLLCASALVVLYRAKASATA